MGVFLSVVAELYRRNREKAAAYDREGALRESEERFRSVLDNSRDVIYRLNVQIGRYVVDYSSAERIIGYSADELMAMDLSRALSLIHPDDLPIVGQHTSTWRRLARVIWNTASKPKAAITAGYQIVCPFQKTAVVDRYTEAAILATSPIESTQRKRCSI